MVTFLWSPPVGLSVGLTFLLAVTRKKALVEIALVKTALVKTVLKTGFDKTIYWLCRFCFLLGFIMSKKPKGFVVLSSHTCSERNLSCFFDIIKPRMKENLQSQ